MRPAQVPLSAASVWSSKRSWTLLRKDLVTAAESWASALSTPEVAARSVCGHLIREVWDLHVADRRWLPEAPGCQTITSTEMVRQLRLAARHLQERPLVEASYGVGLLYTDLLPSDVRGARGAYYTPPVLAERLLDLASAEGVDWSTITALDPACGGGAFLVPVAMRMLGHPRLRDRAPQDQLAHLEGHLAGIELDPFAAWMTRTFLQLVALPQSLSARRPLDVRVDVGDALDAAVDDPRSFDLVVGNPPFGRVSLSEEQRIVFARSLFGHANLYGVFLDAALRWRKSSGWVAFLTPTSFLGGQYFSRLRSLLLAEAPPLAIDIVSDRSGVFPSVQQETCLTVLGPNPSKTTTVHLVEPCGAGLDVTKAGSFELRSRGSYGAPWFLPRSKSQAALAESAARLATRLETLGYRASTGPLVWNRVKSQLCARYEQGTYPLIWAEAVGPNRFSFDYRMRAARRFVRVRDDQRHLLLARPCVLVQRTTSKEQPRRLVACAVPEEFLAQWKAVVVENHVNVLSAPVAARVSPSALAAVLNTRAVDEAFRCLSGSVAVSASELHALPLPEAGLFREVEALLSARAESAPRDRIIEDLVAEAYGIERSHVA